MRDRRLKAVVLCVLLFVVAGCTGGSGRAPRPNGVPASSVEASTRVAIPTVVLLDASGSMRTPDLDGTRVDAARSAIRSLLTSVQQGTAVGLVRIGGSKPDGDPAACDDVAILRTPRAGDQQAVTDAASSVSVTGRTPTGAAMRQGAGLLPAESASSMLIVSDGEANCAPYPCDVAQELHRTHPRLAISAIALHAPATAFRCLTEPSGGVAVGADSAQEVIRRLAVLADPTVARTRLAPGGIDGITLGQSLLAVRRVHSDVTDATIATTPGDVTVVDWRDCSLVFDDTGTLIQIRLRSGATVDGVAVGQEVGAAQRAYGEPIESSATTGSESAAGDRVETFVADPTSGNRWRIISRAGSISRITLCRCGPGSFPRLVPGFPGVATLQALPEAGNDGLFGRWWIRGSTLVVDRAARRVYIWSSSDQQQYPAEAVARIDRIDGAGGAATIIGSSTDSGTYSVGTSLAFSAHPLPSGTVLTVHFAYQPSRDWCGATVIPDCFG